MKDRIDRYSFWNRMRRNIVKWWYVIYTPVSNVFSPKNDEKVEEDNLKDETSKGPEAVAVTTASQTTTEDMTEEERIAKEIFERLQREAAEDEAKKQQEIDLARQEADNLANASYNPTTKSFSGDYGKKEMDDSTKQMVEQILGGSANK